MHMPLHHITYNMLLTSRVRVKLRRSRLPAYSEVCPVGAFGQIACLWAMRHPFRNECHYCVNFSELQK